MTWTDILFSALSVVITALLSWGVAKLIAFIDTKIKNVKTATYLKNAILVIHSVVQETYQTYVESIKGTDAWTKEAQENALAKTTERAKELLSTEIKQYIADNFGDLETWIVTSIESTLYSLKNKKTDEPVE